MEPKTVLARISRYHYLKEYLGHLELYHKEHHTTPTYEIVAFDALTGNMALLKQDILKRVGFEKAIQEFLNGDFTGKEILDKGEKEYIDYYDILVKDGIRNELHDLILMASLCRPHRP